MELFENTPKFLVMSIPQAREQGIIDQWRASMAANHECQAALNTRLNLTNNPTEMQATLLWSAQTFGLERVIALLTISVQHLEYDGRIDASHKEWAKQFDFTPLDGGNQNTCYLVLNAHATRINYAMPYIINAQRNLDDFNQNHEYGAIFNTPEQEDDIER